MDSEALLFLETVALKYGWAIEELPNGRGVIIAEEDIITEILETLEYE